jgi:hypothetical protein
MPVWVLPASNAQPWSCSRKANNFLVALMVTQRIACHYKGAARKSRPFFLDQANIRLQIAPEGMRYPPTALEAMRQLG